MTHLRKIMLEELQRRHYSEATTQRYIRLVERFAQHFHCSPDRLGKRHIREYQAQLFTVQKLSPGLVTNHLCALRFFYIQTLKKPWSIADTPYPKKRHRLPTILSSGTDRPTYRRRSDCLLSHVLMTLKARIQHDQQDRSKRLPAHARLPAFSSKVRTRCGCQEPLLHPRRDQLFPALFLHQLHDRDGRQQLPSCAFQHAPKLAQSVVSVRRSLDGQSVIYRDGIELHTSDGCGLPE